jgi:hypothetical protein
MKKLELFKGMKAKADEDTENESSTEIFYDQGSIGAIFNLLRSMRKDLDTVKQENKLIQEQLTRQQEFNLQLRQEFTRQEAQPSRTAEIISRPYLPGHAA